MAEESAPLQLSAESPAAAPDPARPVRVEKEHDYAHYVAVYGKQIRTIKWWVSQGRAQPDGPDLPPLDRPMDMPAWWDRCMKQKCPPSVLLAARGAAGGASPAAGAGDPGVAPPASMLVPNTFNPAGVVITTADENLQQLREQLARARHDLLEEQNKAEVDPRRVETLQKKWRELREEVEKAEEAAFKLQSKQGRLVDRDQIALQLLPLLATTASSFRSLVTRLKPRLAQTASDEERDLIWQAGCDECFAGLVEAGFMPREMLQLAA